MPYGPSSGPSRIDTQRRLAANRRRYRREHGGRRRAVHRHHSRYAMFGGADFGAGFWDLVAGGTHRGGRPREVIDHSIGPVWEANHVWLIFVLRRALDVLPRGVRVDHPDAVRPADDRRVRHRAARCELRVPQGGARAPATARAFGAVFALSSVMVPYCFGAVAGAIASGRVPAGGVAGDPWDSWVNPTSILGGVLAVVCRARYLAAVYLVWDARRLADARDDRVLPDPSPRRRGRRRGRWRSSASSCCASDAEYLFDGLTSRALPLVIVSAVCGAGSLVLLLRAQPSRRPARGRRRGRRGDRRMGRRPVGLHPSRNAHRRSGRRSVGHDRRGARRHRPRRALRLPGDRVPLRPRPARDAPHGERAGAEHRPRPAIRRVRCRGSLRSGPTRSPRHARRDRPR